MIIKTKKENKKQIWEVMLEEFNQFTYGDTITHNRLERITGVSRNSGYYRSAIAKVKKIMQAQSKMIASVRGEGYRIVEPNEYVYHSASKVSSSCRKMKQALDIQLSAPVDKMTDADRNISQRVLDRLMVVNATMQGERTTIKMLSAPQHAFKAALANQK